MGYLDFFLQRVRSRVFWKRSTNLVKLSHLRIKYASNFRKVPQLVLLQETSSKNSQTRKAHRRCRLEHTNSIDYQCADGRFLISPSDVAISHQNYLSSSGTRVNACRRRRELYLSESNWCQESTGGICFTNKWRAASQRPLTFSNQRPNIVFFFFKLIFGLMVCSLGGEHGVFWKRESRPIKWHQCRLLTNFFFTVWTSMVKVSEFLATYVRDLQSFFSTQLTRRMWERRPLS